MIDEGIKTQIDDYWLNHRHCTAVKKYASRELVEFLEARLAEHPWFETIFNVLSFAVKGIEEPVRCRVCGKELRLDNAREGKTYCSCRCLRNSPEVREKTINTNTERYGCQYPAQNDGVMKKRRMTMKAKYGSECSFTSPGFKEKSIATCMRKYGVDSVGKSEEIRARIRKTLKSRYGAESYMQTDEGRSKSSVMNRKRGYGMLRRWSEYVVPLFTEEEYEGMQGEHHGRIYRWKCMQCGNEFEFSAHGTGLHRELGTCFPRCPHCHQVGSSAEKELADFVKSIYGGKIIENCHDVIKPYELDVYIPDKNIAIEFDGLYWHSEEKIHDASYHLNKTDECMKKSIRLIHVFEDEWNEKQDIVKDRIRSLLGVNNRIYARKCKIKDISSGECNEFLMKNHLQGADFSSVRYGLYHEDELVAVMTFGRPRFNRKYDWELIRFSSKLGYNVVGGASKLLRYFRKNNDGSIISYADRRYSDGNLYEKLGFKKVGLSSPNYWWFRSKRKLSRYECQKHRLKDVLGECYDCTLSESENMKNNGWRRIYDCGNIVCVYEDRKK